ncbi:MAG: WcaF family extracellular polysaccharide biosynthesis acetyltransferase [bacterium]
MKVDFTHYDANNKAYTANIGASQPKQLLWFICSPLLIQNPLIPFSGFRKWVLELFGARIGIEARIRPGVHIKYPWKLTMGDHVWLGENCWIDNITDVVIGSNVCISQGAMLCTGNHDYTSPGFTLVAKSIILEDGVWIGAKALVGPGLTAFSHSVLTAGSIATKNLEAYGIYQGNPATFVKTRTIKP